MPKRQPKQKTAKGLGIQSRPNAILDVTLRKVAPSAGQSASKGHRGVWEISWAYDGRATFEYGPEVEPGNAHIVWRRIGTHAILRRP